MRKFLSIFVSLTIVVGALSGCAHSVESGSAANANNANSVSSAVNNASKGEKLKIVTTIFPAYDWTREVLGDTISDVELTMLLDDGVDLHSFQPTAEDMITIADCDLFVYVGGESDTWVADALANATNPDMKVINMMEALGDDVKAEVMVEGMQETAHDHDGDGIPDHDADDCDDHDDDDHDHDHDNDHDDDADDHDHDHDDDADDHDHDHDDDADDHDHDHDDDADDHDDHDHDDDCDDAHDHTGIENDEHVWLSLDHAGDLCDVITGALVALNPEQADTYKANNAAYQAKLDALDNQYEAMVDGATHKTIIMPDRFPFRYLADDYDIGYYAAFVGCSAETEASFETIAFLAGKVDELNVENVLVTESSDNKIADTVIATSKANNQGIVVLDSMQAVSAKDVAAGTTYLSIMEANLVSLTTAMQ